MNENLFNLYEQEINSLSDKQFLSLKSKIKELDYGKFLATNLDQCSDIKSCKHCNSIFINKWGRRHNMQRYKCKICKKTFNSLSKTPLARLKKKHKWIKYAECLKSGFTVRKSAEICDIHANTSFKWRHRFLQNTTSIKAKSLIGISEMDSVIMVKSYKGSKEIPRLPRKRGLSTKAMKESKERFSVFFIKNRASYVYDKIFNKVCNESSGFSMDEICLSDTLLCSKKNTIYANFTKNKKTQHSTIKKRKNTLKNTIIHTDNVKKYYKSLFIWMNRFNGVATKYLDNYLSWFRFLDEFEKGIKAESIILRAKSGGPYKYQPLFST